MGMDVGTKGGVRSDINITPLVVVVLVLLIIFMVITPMLQRGKSVDLPKAKHAMAGKEGPDPLFVSVTKDGNVFIEQEKQPASKEELLAALKGAAETPGKRVMFKADQETEYGKVRPVLILQADFLLAADEPTVIVLPLTTQVRASKEPIHVTIVARDRLRETCQVITEQPRTLDRRRLLDGPLTRLTREEMSAVEKSFRVVAGLP